MTIKIEESGWYDEDYQCVATDDNALMDYLESTGELTDLVTEYICDNYDMEDFIHDIVAYEGFYMSREDMIEEFRRDNVIEGKSFDAGCTYLEWYDKGDEIEED